MTPSCSVHRIHLAKRLLDESQLPITKIAHYAGFQSIREFNHALRLSTSDNSKPLEETIHRLREVCGIEETLAQWIAMRSYGEPDAFPSGDRGLRLRMGDSAMVAAADLQRVAESWRPWRAYAAIHLTV